MVGGRLRTGLAVAIAGVAVAAPPIASGATTVGQTAPSAGVTFNCGGPSTFISAAAAPGTPAYEVPADGVLTSWSVRGGTLPAPGMLKLKLLRPTGVNTWEVVAEDPTLRAIPATVLSSFSVRIPVGAGQFLGLWVPVPGVTPCSYMADGAANVLTHRSGANPEPTVGQTYVTNAVSDDFRTNVSAVLEPDGDGDGFGDESQDQCATDATVQGPCPTGGGGGGGGGADTDAPEVTITKGAPNKTTKHKVKFKFESNEPGSTFECKKDKKPWKPCTSPTKMKRLDEGKHKFKVRATDPAGNTGKPAKDKFRVVD